VSSPENPILYWLETNDVAQEVYVHSRTFFSKYKNGAFQSDLEIEDLIYKEHIYIDKSELMEIIETTVKTFNFNPIGTGLELGAGCAAISVELAKKFPRIERIYAVEIVPEIVELAQTELIRIAGVEGRVIPVLGDFDNLKLPNASMDWIIEFDSLHHSFDLSRTAHESFRVLKPGGVLIAIDRAHWRTSRSRMDSLENEPYSKAFLEARGWDATKKITRADNGEHEHLISDYERHFREAGFSSFEWRNLLAPEWSVLKLSLISLIPWRLRANTKYRYVQMWPIWKLFIPIITFRLTKQRTYKKFICLARKKNSKRFQLKTIVLVTK